MRGFAALVSSPSPEVSEGVGAGRPTLARRLAFSLAPFAAFALLLLGVEAATRASCAHVPRLELFVAAPEQHAGFTDREKIRIFEGDPLLFWRLKADLDRVVWDFTLVSTNAQGLRHRGPLRPRRPGTVRVLCLGDSVTFGYRVPLGYPNQSRDEPGGGLPYPMLVEDRLRAANPGRGIDVVAMAVPGYSSHQGLAWLRQEAARLKPDLVTACFGWNDVSLRLASDRDTMKTGAVYVAVRAAVSRSQVLTHAVLWLRGRAAVSGARDVPRVPLDDYVANHLEMARLARVHGAAFLAIGPVYRDAFTFPAEATRLRGHRDALRSALNRAGVPYLDVPELTEDAHPGNRDLFGELIHPNADGHERLADALLARLAADRLLPQLVIPHPR